MSNIFYKNIENVTGFQKKWLTSNMFDNVANTEYMVHMKERITRIKQMHYVAAIALFLITLGFCSSDQRCIQPGGSRALRSLGSDFQRHWS